MAESYVAIHQGKKNGRMMLESIENGPLVYPTIEENGAIRPKNMQNSLSKRKLQDDYDFKETNIVSFQGLAVPSFLPGDDPITCLNKVMAFMSTIMASRFPSTNNQLRSSNSRNQATILHGRVTVQQVQGRQGQSFARTGNKGNATSSRGNNVAGQARVVKRHNCQGEGNMERQCNQPKRPRNSAWLRKRC
ncbi:hypothetical protein Tco_0072560 [Tanacetum coccineum]